MCKGKLMQLGSFPVSRFTFHGPWLPSSSSLAQSFLAYLASIRARECIYKRDVLGRHEAFQVRQAVLDDLAFRICKALLEDEESFDCLAQNQVGHANDSCLQNAFEL